MDEVVVDGKKSGHLDPVNGDGDVELPCDVEQREGHQRAHDARHRLPTAGEAGDGGGEARAAPNRPVGGVPGHGAVVDDVRVGDIRDDAVGGGLLLLGRRGLGVRRREHAAVGGDRHGERGRDGSIDRSTPPNRARRWARTRPGLMWLWKP